MRHTLAAAGLLSWAVVGASFRSQLRSRYRGADRMRARM